MRLAKALLCTCTAMLALTWAAACGGSKPKEVISPSPSPVLVSTPPVSPPGSPLAVPAPQQPAVTHDCKVLLGLGMTYDRVLAYWLSLGSPPDMDDDHDGLPCETVYGQRN
jgi:hypothetical protein